MLWLHKLWLGVHRIRFLISWARQLNSCCRFPSDLLCCHVMIDGLSIFSQRNNKSTVGYPNER